MTTPMWLEGLSRPYVMTSLRRGKPMSPGRLCAGACQRAKIRRMQIHMSMTSQLAATLTNVEYRVKSTWTMFQSVGGKLPRILGFVLQRRSVRAGGQGNDRAPDRCKSEF